MTRRCESDDFIAEKMDRLSITQPTRFHSYCIKPLYYSSTYNRSIDIDWFTLLIEGESVEVQYALHSYGIPTEHIPLTFSGNIKDGYIKQWLKMRGYIESIECTFRIIECPQLADVLFRQGVSSSSYPGNSRVYHLVEKRYQDTTVTVKRGTVKNKRDKVVREIIEHIRSSGGRFLVWNELGWWNELLEIGLLSTKLEYFIKEILRAKKKEARISVTRHQIQLDSSTSLFQNRFDEIGCSNKRTKYNWRCKKFL